jgi:dihydrodipicolinate reductase
MGKNLIEAVGMTKGLELTAATEHPDSSLIGADAGEVAGVGKLGVTIAADLAAVVNDFDVVIDFTGLAPTLNHLSICRVIVETPVKLTGAQRDLIMQLDESLRGGGSTHNPNAHGWLDKVKGFFKDVGL